MTSTRWSGSSTRCPTSTTVLGVSDRAERRHADPEGCGLGWMEIPRIAALLDTRDRGHRDRFLRIRRDRLQPGVTA
jgi:hypothetical protein